MSLKVSSESKALFEILEWALKSDSSIHSYPGIISITNTIDALLTNFWLRIRSSDALVFKQIILLKELEPALLFFQNRKTPPKLMLDGGGNIGLSSRYMLAYFPGLFSLIVEPHEGNADMIRKNLPDNRYRLIQQAIWFENGIVYPDIEKNKVNSEWGFSFHASDIQKIDKGIVARSIKDILENSDIKNLDYLKLDIEGAEEVIFKKDLSLSEVLEKVCCISVEAHSLEFEKDLITILKKSGFRVKKSGELVFGFRDE
ncbi:FkbM family methyltransferase [Algoriphagus persicinus]|uniref:FkbM family methyltransferase n=1 Tax=Algoriphagus persicinus TaxID=3108754 RepID=UPI002B3E5DB2|nr:FkbM family methyltransferase [Algoriphagus sp. E1-3-M2]MEB2784738.1 FkbM family methyltransferase [Algoriphagus sp. E1-3-M2]